MALDFKIPKYNCRWNLQDWKDALKKLSRALKENETTATFLKAETENRYGKDSPVPFGRVLDVYYWTGQNKGKVGCAYKPKKENIRPKTALTGNILVRNHLLCPYSDCEAHNRQKSPRIRIKVDEERNVTLSQSEKGEKNKTSLPYQNKKWEKPTNCPYCNRELTVVIDETHNGRNIYLRKT